MRPEIGDLISGYCGGFFGRDGYGRKRIEGVGSDWIVARHEDGHVLFASFKSTDERDKEVDNWRKFQED